MVRTNDVHGYLYLNENNKLRVFITDNLHIEKDGKINILRNGNYPVEIDPKTVIYHTYCRADDTNGKNFIFHERTDKEKIYLGKWNIDLLFERNIHCDVINPIFFDMFLLYLQKGTGDFEDEFWNYDFILYLATTRKMEHHNLLFYPPYPSTISMLDFWSLFCETFGITQNMFKEITDKVIRNKYESKPDYVSPFDYVFRDKQFVDRERSYVYLEKLLCYTTSALTNLRLPLDSMYDGIKFYTYKDN
jgi:hypothetical protein